jgi:uncharacterized protein YrrD
MRFSEALGHKVVSLATAETVGLLDELIVDPQSRRVVALGVKKSKSGDTLVWNGIESFGPDAVTVSDADKIAGADRDVDRLSGKDHHFLSKRVLLTVGDEVGAVEDVEFDPLSGDLLAILTSGESIGADRLVGVGSYAVVVRPN